MLAVELAGQGSWIDAPMWAVNGGSPTYMGAQAGVSDLGLLTVIELAAVGFVDKQRTAETGEKRLYPGGSFDPLNYGADKSKLAELQVKEIKNGAPRVSAASRQRVSAASRAARFCSITRRMR